MKIPGAKKLMTLGQSEPTGGIPVDLTPPPTRPNVIDEGVEFEIVFFPHRNAPSLLGDEVSRPSTLTLVPAPVRLTPEDPNTKDRWSWLG